MQADFFTILSLLLGLTWLVPSASAGQEGKGQKLLPPELPAAAAAEEQVQSFVFRNDVFVYLNAPVVRAVASSRTPLLILYGLPNGNTIDQTFGKRLQAGDDWHYDIQHVGAQIRFLRAMDPPFTPILALLQTRQRSWPAWKSVHPGDYGERTAALVDTLRGLCGLPEAEVVLTGHSGGGRFIFSFLDQCGEIPAFVRRIVFIDSNYGYENRYAAPLARWLSGRNDKVLLVFAYNDSVALLDGRRVVSDSGGTWHRSGRMIRDLSRYFSFTARKDTAFQHWSALQGRVQFLLKENPHQGIWHTQQVARNGLIHALLAVTSLENHRYRYWGERAFTPWIGDGSQVMRGPKFPARSPTAAGGREFIARIDTLPAAEREQLIFTEIGAGNLPAFLRQTRLIAATWADAAGDSHRVVFRCCPDYLAVGSEGDFVRMPMTPVTAQKLADLFDACLPTRKLVDAIHAAAAVKLAPQFYAPDGDRNERPATFFRHQEEIEKQLAGLGAEKGELISGSKKDIVISNRLSEPGREGHVAIYGWHRPDGQPIQPLTNIHSGRYADYSHGVRLIGSTLLVDGVPRRMTELLGDSLLYKLISDEEGPMPQSSYKTE